MCNPPFAVNADGYCGEPHFPSLQPTQDFSVTISASSEVNRGASLAAALTLGMYSLAMPRMAAKEACNRQNPHCSWLALLALPVLILL